MRAFLQYLANVPTGIVLLTSTWALTASVTALAAGGGWEWGCVLGLALWPAWRAFGAIALAAEAQVAAWVDGTDYDTELAWRALQRAVCARHASTGAPAASATDP